MFWTELPEGQLASTNQADLVQSFNQATACMVNFSSVTKRWVEAGYIRFLYWSHPVLITASLPDSKKLTRKRQMVDEVNPSADCSDRTAAQFVTVILDLYQPEHPKNFGK